MSTERKVIKLLESDVDALTWRRFSQSLNEGASVNYAGLYWFVTDIKEPGATTEAFARLEQSDA